VGGFFGLDRDQNSISFCSFNSNGTRFHLQFPKREIGTCMTFSSYAKITRSRWRVINTSNSFDYMSPERDQNHISIEEIVSNAKEIMLRDGNHVPIVIVEGNKSVVAGQIPDMPPTHGERVELMRFLGQAAAKSGRVDQLQQVFMVSEGWISETNEDKPTGMRPSEDPNRKEVLIISAMKMEEGKKQMKIFEIMRDGTGQMVGFEELLPDIQKKDESIEIPLLDAFVQGFQTAFRTKYN